jgi:hypothetical protein
MAAKEGLNILDGITKRFNLPLLHRVKSPLEIKFTR